MTGSPFRHLLEPLDLGWVRLRNRALMGSMHTGLEDHEANYPRLAAYFAARARGGAGLIVTGGIAPNRAGWVAPFAGKLTASRELPRHRLVTEAVHAEGGHICMQILHAGRYAHHPLSVAPSAIKAPISRFRPWQLSSRGVERQIAAFVRAATLARAAGYDGVEIMGSEGYLINEFISARTNRRDDQWGGSYRNRMRFPVEILRRTRAAVGPDFILIYRLSMLDLVEGGSAWAEVVELAQAVEAAGATLINTGIGWHEARVPTIATMVPRAAFAWVTERLMPHVKVPLIATNRINDPAVAEAILARGGAAMVSMARPFLADPEFVNKARDNRADEINVCIACNQACLDHVFEQKTATCLVNPRAARETELIYRPADTPRRIAVVGAGPAGLSCATVSAERGHRVTLFERAAEIGGQFNMAKRVPGKEEFHATLRFFRRQLEILGVDLRLSTDAGVEALAGRFDSVVLATGVSPRWPPIPGVEHRKVVSYADVLLRDAPVGRRVAIVGAGGIGFDVAEFLTHDEGHAASLDVETFARNWGIDLTLTARGGLASRHGQPASARREVWLLQRKTTKLGEGLGRTTGWVHRIELRRRGVQMVGGVSYDRIDDDGLHLRIGEQPKLIAADTIVVCAGQEPLRELAEPLRARGIDTHLIGGADVAAELDAKRAIRQGAELAARL
ncbi:MAG TPA: NADPH-dependent 2,4-dienoyl-CoA reductase [Steroidobacteraceae bacterium]|nr:NADPH-dependent 2,4-dienoyl-CoA reductase [Steroidobacteraceae bacterium]